MTTPASTTHPDVVAVLEEFRRCLPSTYTVVRFDAAKLDVIVNDGRDRTLIFREEVLLKDLRDDSSDGVWGPEVSRLESVARLMTVHLDEALGTRDGGPSERWHHTGGWFDPEP